MLTKHNFRIKSGSQILSADSAHVLYDHMIHLSGFDIDNQTPHAGRLNYHRNNAVGIVDNIIVARLVGVAFQICESSVKF